MKQLWNVLGQICGFLTIALYAFLYTHEQFHFAIDQSIIDILYQVKEFAALGVAAIVGMELVSGKGLFVLIYLIILAVVVVFMFFPSLGDNLVNLINGWIGA